MQPLAGKVSIVTGAIRGIGKAISILLAQSGSRVVLAARSVAGKGDRRLFQAQHGASDRSFNSNGWA